MTTSLTDTTEYREFCRLAATDPVVFQSFRRQPEYEHVVYVSEENGGRYLSRLTAKPVQAAGVTGDPRMFMYPAVSVPLDPVLIRYHHDRQEIRRFFGDTSILNVLEIGGGFGGLAHLMLPYCRSYSICDLPEVRLLQDAYLARFGQQVDDADPFFESYDLVVSTFAFSELTPATAHSYIEEYVSRIPRGWMICNFLAPDQLHADELDELLPGRWEPETPETHVTNKVRVWGDR